MEVSLTGKGRIGNCRNVGKTFLPGGIGITIGESMCVSVVCSRMAKKPA